MGVYVKGMKMPLRCNGCMLDIGFRCGITREDITNEIANTHNRHKNCPLVDVPETHGRLIIKNGDEEYEIDG